MTTRTTRESLYEHAGGEPALHRLEQSFYDSVLADPLLHPLREVPRWTWAVDAPED
jgi:truncated hemoglobin YjbI